MNSNEGNTPIVEPERKIYPKKKYQSDLTQPDKNPGLGEQLIWWGLHSKYPKSRLKGCVITPGLLRYHHLTMPALGGPESIPTGTFSLLYDISERTNHNEEPVIVLQDEL